MTSFFKKNVNIFSYEEILMTNNFCGKLTIGGKEVGSMELISFWVILKQGQFVNIQIA